MKTILSIFFLLFLFVACVHTPANQVPTLTDKSNPRGHIAQDLLCPSGLRATMSASHPLADKLFGRCLAREDAEAFRAQYPGQFK
jgi:hypothetical protein